MGDYKNYSASTANIESGSQRTDDIIITPIVTKYPDAVKSSNHFGIFDRADAAILSAAFQDEAIISQCNV